MSRITFPSHPLLLGFEHLEQLVERTARAGTDGYPPFNIEHRGRNAFRITLAVAGFREAQLTITIENRQLVVRGAQAEEAASDGRVMLHRGIAARQFQRAFALAEGVEVAGAHLEDGLLHIDLTRHDPEPHRQSVPITRASR